MAIVVTTTQAWKVGKCFMRKRGCITVEPISVLNVLNVTENGVSRSRQFRKLTLETQGRPRMLLHAHYSGKRFTVATGESDVQKCL